MGGAIRRVLSGLAIVGLATVAFAGVAAAPAPAAATDVTGYTIQWQAPRGLNQIFTDCRLAQINLTTGVVTPIGPYRDAEDLPCASDLAFSPSGVLYGIVEEQVVNAPSVDGNDTPSSTVAPQAIVENGFVHLVTYNLGTGVVTDVGVIGTDEAELGRGGGITFDAAGNLYVYMIGFDTDCDGDAVCLYKVDPTTPANATFVGDDPQETYLVGLASNCAGQNYTLEETPSVASNEDVFINANADLLASVNTTGGVATVVGAEFGGGRFLQSLDFDPTGQMWAIGTVLPKGLGEEAFVFTVNHATGTITAGSQVSVATGTFTFIQGLAIAPLSCTVPTPPPPPAVIPAFTG